MSKAKANGQYVNSILALSEALANGYDEALLLDTQGFVAEGSGENFFLVQDGVIYTPELTSALAGITRSTVITLAGELGYEVRQKQLTRDEVYVADEAFFTGTAAEVTPIREVRPARHRHGSRGPVTERCKRPTSTWSTDAATDTTTGSPDLTALDPTARGSSSRAPDPAYT